MRVRIVLILFTLALSANADYREFKDFPVDPSIETKLRHVAESTLKDFPKLKAEDLSLTMVELTNMSTISRGDYHGDAPFYPASVVKLFYMAEIYHQKKETLPDVPRALGEMIHVSDNDATAFILDAISDTCSGPELDGRALKKFIDKRSVVNRWLVPLGYDISAMAKPWSFGPFGRDVQLLGANREHRNRATANAVASMLLWIVRGRAVSPEASKAMMELLNRPMDTPRKDENQIKEFLGEALPAGSKLWSKAGWTSEVRNDAAYIELPNGKKFILVVFTRGIADDVKLLPAIGAKVLAEMQ
ncbi:MAG TPA: serine hydrolase [Thermoanaerobaculia bacterium]|nr:serine hydrolase [Thermoanaerobaculia bacterium]